MFAGSWLVKAPNTPFNQPFVEDRAGSQDRADQTKANLKRAAEKVKDALPGPLTPQLPS